MAARKSYFRLTYFIYFILVCYIPLVSIFLPKTHFGAGIPDLDVVRIISYLLLLSFSMDLTIHSDIKILHKWTFILFLFIFIVFVSVSWSKELYNQNFLQTYFDSLFIPFVIALVGINIFRDKENIHKVIRHIAYVAPILSLVGIVQFIFGYTEATGTIRAFGTFRGPNGFAVFLALTIPIILYAGSQKIIPKYFLWIAMLCIIGGVLSTVSRKGFLAMMVALISYFFIKKEFIKIGLILTIAVIVGLIMSESAFFSQRFARFQKAELDIQVLSKWNMTLAGLKMFLESPWIGLGYKGYNRNFGRFFPHASKKNYDAHNEFVTALANYGIIGFLAFLAIFFYPFFYSVRLLQMSPRTPEIEFRRDMAAICISIIIPFAMSLFFAGAMFYVNQYVVTLYYTSVAFIFVDYYQK